MDLYELNDEYGTPYGILSEEYMRIAPKFKVGDEVLWYDEKVEVTEVSWSRSWRYKLRRNDGKETDYLLQGNLRPVRNRLVTKL